MGIQILTSLKLFKPVINETKIHVTSPADIHYKKRLQIAIL